MAYRIYLKQDVAQEIGIEPIQEVSTLEYNYGCLINNTTYLPISNVLFVKEI